MERLLTNPSSLGYCEEHLSAIDLNGCSEMFNILNGFIATMGLCDQKGVCEVVIDSSRFPLWSLWERSDVGRGWAACLACRSKSSLFSFQPSTTKSLQLMDVSGDEIAEAVLKQFEDLPGKAKPLNRGNGVREWVPLSGIVAQGIP